MAASNRLRLLSVTGSALCALQASPINSAPPPPIGCAQLDGSYTGVLRSAPQHERGVRMVLFLDLQLSDGAGSGQYAFVGDPDDVDKSHHNRLTVRCSMSDRQVVFTLTEPTNRLGDEARNQLFSAPVPISGTASLAGQRVRASLSMGGLPLSGWIEREAPMPIPRPLILTPAIKKQ